MDGEYPLGTIYIRTFGKFSIECEGVALSEQSVRTKKAWLLIQYLVTNRDKDLSVDRIITDIWGTEENDDPLNVLKNLVYRARNILKKLAPGKDVDFILYKQNTYSWNSALPCEIDCEAFVSHLREAEGAADDNQRIDRYIQAISLYTGEFLPQSSYADWVVSRSTALATTYLNAVERVSQLLEEQGRLDELVEIVERAATLYLLEERVHRLLLHAYVASGRYSKAIKHYNYISELFYKELGVCLSDDIRSMYRQIITGISSVEMDLSSICEDLRESVQVKGAYFCDYEVFKNIYRVQARSISRTGQSIHVVLMTVLNENGLADEKTIRRGLDELRNILLSSLRRGDVVSAFSASQFVVMLPMTTLEQAQMVPDRLLEKYHTLQVQVNIRPLTPFE